MTESSPESVAAAYFEAWKSNDIHSVRPLLHENVSFIGALASTQGVDDTLAGLSKMFAMTRQLKIVRRWVDGADVLTWFELHTDTAGPIPVVNWSHIEAGRVTQIRVTFDPRPLLD